MPEYVKKAVLELLRVVVLAIIPVAITSIEAGSPNWEAIAVVGAVAGLRFLDKLLHEAGKHNNLPQLERGITQF